MEQLQLPFFCFLFSVFVISITVLITRSRCKSSASTDLNRPPGPPLLPLIGSLHHLIGPELPHRRLSDLAHRYGPDLMLVRLGQVDSVVVTSLDATEEVFKKNDINFSSRPKLAAVDMLTYGYTNIFFSPYGSYWRQLRKICMTELLTAKRVKSFTTLREEEILNLVGEITASVREPVNLSHKLVSLTNRIIFRAVMGKRSRHEEKCFEMVKEGTKLVLGTTVSDMFPSLRFLDVINGTRSSLKKLSRSLDEILDEIVDDHEKALPTKSVKDDDILDVLLRLKDSGELDIPLTRNNIKAVIEDLFGAGTDTSSTTMEWAMAELIKNPEKMNKAQTEIRQALAGKTKIEEGDIADMKYLKLVIKETLRLHPPAPLIPRECTESCQVQGYTIPRGWKVIVNVWALGRDPKHWEDADRFEPERFDGSSVDFRGSDFSYLPFGAGRRICPGITFSMATIELALAHLLNSFDWELPGGTKAEELDMSENLSASVSRKSALCLVATRKYTRVS